ncbi:MAG TPA: putative glycolipid-binding domain-containing protein [Gaiellaceae bacterium]|nr:putative glycolipid-binding domain-containing protein [Gaiellaceae bacterium]
MVTALWRGLDEPRLEIARVEIEGDEVRASGTQIGVTYELRYELEPGLLRLEVVGERTREVALDSADFFDLGFSPLLNSLPVVRDRLLEGGPAHEYVMRWVDVPSLEVSESAQRYEPVDDGTIRFNQADFTAMLTFGADLLVERYEGLAERLR